MWSSNSDNSDLHSAALIFDATTTQFDIDKSDEYAKLQFWCLMKGSYVPAGPEHMYYWQRFEMAIPISKMLGYNFQDN